MLNSEVYRRPEKWTISIREMVASFVFVLLFFTLVSPLILLGSYTNILFGVLLFSLIYFSICWYYKPNITVHILPIISFIIAIHYDNFKCFFLRLSGQFIGGLGAVFIYLTITVGDNFDYSSLVKPLNPFLTGLFMGITSQIVYFLSVLIMQKNKKTNYLKFYLFSLGLGILYYITFFLEGISLFNPFGLLFGYFFGKPNLGFIDILVDFIIHILIPMTFITGTHFFRISFLRNKLNKKD